MTPDMPSDYSERQYLELEQRLRWALVRDALLRGSLGPLAFLWTAGLAVFLAWLESVPVAGVWTGAVALIGAGMFRTHMSDPKAAAVALHTVVRRSYPVLENADERARAAAARAHDLIVAVTVRVRAIEREGGENNYLRAALAAVYELFTVYQLGSQKGDAGHDSAFLAELEGVLQLLEEVRVVDGQTDAEIAVEVARQTEQAVERWRSPGGPGPQPPVVPAAPRPAPSPAEEPPELTQLRRNVELALAQADFADGRKALDRLVSERRTLLVHLGPRRETDPLSLAQLPGEANGVCDQGLSMLLDAAGYARSIQGEDESRIQADISRLEGEVKALRDSNRQADPDGVELLRIREGSLEDRRRRLRKVKDHHLQIAKLLRKCEQFEADLIQARMELPVIRSLASEERAKEVADRLRRTVQVAREVQDEVRQEIRNM